MWAKKVFFSKPPQLPGSLMITVFPRRDEAWVDAGAELLVEPLELERRFRVLTRSRQSSPQLWADAYLAAFAEAAQVTLVTFDRAFRGKVKPLILLGE